MLTLREVAACEGYYIDIVTGDILRNVRPEQGECDQDAPEQNRDAETSPDVPRFDRLSEDVTASLEEVIAAGTACFGRPLSGRIINRQTAMQPDGVTVTEESRIY